MKEEVKGLYAAILLSAIAILAVNWIWPAQEVVTEEKPVAEIKAEVEKMEVKPGDKVIYSKYAGTNVKFGAEEYIVVKQNDILAIIQ